MDLIHDSVSTKTHKLHISSVQKQAESRCHSIHRQLVFTAALGGAHGPRLTSSGPFGPGPLLSSTPVRHLMWAFLLTFTAAAASSCSGQWRYMNNKLLSTELCFRTRDWLRSRWFSRCRNSIGQRDSPLRLARRNLLPLFVDTNAAPRGK